jgi:methionine sulfoxide reductase catalytic subunit
MFIRRPRPEDCARIAPSEITSHSAYLNRREILLASARLGAGLGLMGASLALPATASAANKLSFTRNDKLSVSDKPTSHQDVTSYNNFYEFGTGKEDPAQNSSQFKATPWKVAIKGEAEVTGDFNLEDILKPHALEQRVYRMRCVEAWSMVIPWVGVPLADVIKRFKPTSKAKYVAFTTVHRPSEMPGQRYGSLDWPYVEGLRIDEAMNPLALLATGIYDEALPNQCGAPLRLVTPWKYGFKGIKSIVEIRFTEKEPPTSWNIANGREYGFYANVNPKVDHPRWSQASERRIGASLLASRQPTLMFNGYEEQVADLYKGMDLKRNF